jgi:hypothetical protein
VIKSSRGCMAKHVHKMLSIVHAAEGDIHVCGFMTARLNLVQRMGQGCRCAAGQVDPEGTTSRTYLVQARPCRLNIGVIIRLDRQCVFMFVVKFVFV